MARTKAGRKKRKARQRVAVRYVKAREDAQLAGLIETLPAGAVRSERVDPGTQGCQPLPGLVRAALRDGWSAGETRQKHERPPINGADSGALFDALLSITLSLLLKLAAKLTPE